MGGKNSYESIKRYQDKAYDKVLVRLPKGKKDVIQAHAAALCESINAFITRAIQEAIERDTAATGLPTGTGVVSLPSDVLNAAQEAAERTGEGLPEFMGRAVAAQAQRDAAKLAFGVDPHTGKVLEKEEA